MTVKELKEKLEKVVNELEDYDDDQEIHMVSNTYFLGDYCRMFLGLSGWDGGYIDLSHIQIEDDDEDEEDY